MEYMKNSLIKSLSNRLISKKTNATLGFRMPDVAFFLLPRCVSTIATYLLHPFFLPQSLQVELVCYVLRRGVISDEHGHVDWQIGHGT